jgi:hypothetical protein
MSANLKEIRESGFSQMSPKKITHIWSHDVEGSENILDARKKLHDDSKEELDDEDDHYDTDRQNVRWNREQEKSIELLLESISHGEQNLRDFFEKLEENKNSSNDIPSSADEIKPKIEDTSYLDAPGHIPSSADEIKPKNEDTSYLEAPDHILNPYRYLPEGTELYQSLMGLISGLDADGPDVELDHNMDFFSQAQRCAATGAAALDYFIRQYGEDLQKESLIEEVPLDVLLSPYEHEFENEDLNTEYHILEDGDVNEIGLNQSQDSEADEYLSDIGVSTGIQAYAPFKTLARNVRNLEREVKDLNEVEIYVDPRAEETHVYIVDDGPGIPEEEQESLTEFNSDWEDSGFGNPMSYRVFDSAGGDLKYVTTEDMERGKGVYKPEEVDLPDVVNPSESGAVFKCTLPTAL